MDSLGKESHTENNIMLPYELNEINNQVEQFIKEDNINLNINNNVNNNLYEICNTDDPSKIRKSSGNFNMIDANVNVNVKIHNQKQEMIDKLLNSHQQRAMCGKQSGGRILGSGVRLYHKCLELREKSLKKTSCLKKEKAKKEMTECTFTPRISEYAQTYWFKPNEVKGNLGINIISYSKPSNDVRSMYNNFCAYSSTFSSATTCRKFHSLSNNENSKTSFGENKTSSHLIKRTKEEIAQHSEKLFSDAEKLQTNRTKYTTEFYKKQCSFSPQISKSQEKVGCMRHPNHKSNQNPHIQNFFYRLQKWIDKKNEQLNSQVTHTDYPKQDRHTLNYNKCTELFEDWKCRQAKSIQNEQILMREILTNSNATHVGNKSREILEQLFVKIFNEIFDEVSSNCAILDKNRLNTNTLPGDIIEIFQPLLNELVEQNETLSQNEFYLACRQLYEMLTVDQKQKLIEWHFSLRSCLKKNSKNEFTFKPRLCGNPSHLPSKDFYTRSSEYIKNKETKRNQALKMTKEDLSECTFTPKLIAKPMEGIFSSRRHLRYFSKGNCMMAGHLK